MRSSQGSKRFARASRGGGGVGKRSPVFLRAGRYSDAAEAYARAVKVLGPSPKLLSGQGQALVLANNGLVTKEARIPRKRRRATERCSSRVSSSPSPRNKTGNSRTLSKIGGRSSPMPRRTSPGARWRKRLQAAEAHLPAHRLIRASPAQAGTAKGPTSADIAAAQAWTRPSARR